MVKKRKCKAVVVEAEDRISNLADNILHHILSYLPTKEAVHTCVLSRRWKYIWTGIHTLDFDEEYDGNSNSRIDFLNCVQKVLLLHDGSVINIFKLVIFADFSTDRITSHIEALLSTILSCKIQQLDLWIGSPILYPPSLFSYNSFTCLKLDGGKCSFRLPASVCFPSLKIMHLELITFASEQRIQQVSFSCPVLEELKFWFCEYLVRTIHLFVPELKRLTIKDWTDIPRSPPTSEIKMHAKCLDFLDVKNGLPCAFSFCNLLSLNSAAIDIDRSDFVKYLVRGIRNVKELTLSYYTFQHLLTSRKDLLALSNLKKLTLDRISLSSELFTELLYSVPHIHSLIFIDMAHNHFFEDYDFTVVDIPKSFLSPLKLIEIRLFRGEESEFTLVEMLLKNVRTIEKMIIVPSYDLTIDLKKQNEVMRRLLILPRASSCVIDFNKSRSSR